MEFGFCYGVERAVEYAYETVHQFPRSTDIPDRRNHPQSARPITSSRKWGIRFLPSTPSRFPPVPTNTASWKKDDVVIIPAFGIPAADIDLLSKKGCVVVDTTCGSVLNVWKNVERYSRLGVTSVIHGKFEHEETQATFSRTTLYRDAHFLVLRDKKEAARICEFIASGGNAASFMDTFRAAVSPGFDPDVHLQRIGLANQTTMLSSESLEIAEMLRVAMIVRYGNEDLAEHFYSFDHDLQRGRRIDRTRFSVLPAITWI